MVTIVAKIYVHYRVYELSAHGAVTPNINLNVSNSADSSETCITSNDKTASSSSDNSQTEIELVEITSNSHIDFSDPAKWPLINNETRLIIIERGLNHSDITNYIFPESEDGRHFSVKWFYKNLLNGEKIRRQWLVYSHSTDKMYCYPCVLFSKSKTCAFTNGYCDWKHLNPNISVHENTIAHRRCYIEWKDLENRLSKGKKIDDDFQKIINVEKKNGVIF